jgi:hypothetical protein
MNKQVFRIKTHLFLRLFGIIIGTSIALAAQGQYASKANLHDTGDELIIEYSIANSRPNDRFEIGVIITDENGNTIDAKSFSGDIGKNIQGGLKKILWNYKDDGIEYETRITVRIAYEKLDRGSEVPAAMYKPATKTYSRSGLILQSLALPGLGMTKLKGKPFWIYGAAAYGLAGYSLYNYFINIEGVWKDYENGDATYQDYEAAYDDHINMTLYTACGAAVIWLTDIVLISVSSKSLDQSASRRFQLAPGYDYRTRTPLLTMTYQF